MTMTPRAPQSLQCRGYSPPKQCRLVECEVVARARNELRTARLGGCTRVLEQRPRIVIALTSKEHLGELDFALGAEQRCADFLVHRRRMTEVRLGGVDLAHCRREQ